MTINAETARIELARLDEVTSKSSGRPYLTGYIEKAKIVVLLDPGEVPKVASARNVWRVRMSPTQVSNGGDQSIVLATMYEYVSRSGKQLLAGRCGLGRMLIVPDPSLKPKSDRACAVWRLFIEEGRLH